MFMSWKEKLEIRHRTQWGKEYNIIYETSRQSRFDARYWMLGAGALGRPRGMVWGGRREEGSGWETHVYLWQIHFDIWQNQYNIVKLKNKIKKSGTSTEKEEKLSIFEQKEKLRGEERHFFPIQLLKRAGVKCWSQTSWKTGTHWLNYHENTVGRISSM